MPREYLHIQRHAHDILSLKEIGCTCREIGERLGLQPIKVKKFLERQRAHYAARECGRTDPHALAAHTQEIRLLKMENTLMRDFPWDIERR